MGLLGQMTVRFGGDTSGLSGAVHAAKGILGQLANGNPLGALGLGFAAVATAAVGFGISSVKAAGDFQQSMSKVQAYANLTKQQTDDLGNSILSLATAMGQSPKAMADALYPIISSGYSASQAINILKLSAMTAAASGAKMSTVADALTTSLKAMHAPASDAGQYMDYINKIVSLGKGEVPQYAAVIGKLALSAGSAKVPFSDMGAALATLTTHGFPSVAQASTSLGNLFTQIGPKVDAVAAHAKKLGLAFDENAFKTKDLAGKLDYLKEITGGNQGELLKLVGGSTIALKAFNALSGSSKDFSSNLTAMKGATGTTNSVFKTTYGDWNNTVARLGATFDVVKIKIGDIFLPMLSGMVSNITPIISKIGDWITKSGGLNGIMDTVGGVLKNVGGDVKNLAVPIGHLVQSIMGVVQRFIDWNSKTHLVQNVLGVVGGIIQGITGFVGGLIDKISGLVTWFTTTQAGGWALYAVLGVVATILAGAAIDAIMGIVFAIPGVIAGFAAWVIEAWLTAAANIAAFWPIYLVVGIIIGIIALVILAVKNWGAIAHWLQGVWGAISGFFKGLWNGIVGAFQAVVDFFHGAVSKIGGAFSGLGSMMHNIWNGIVGVVKGAVNIIIGAIDQFISFIDGIQIHIPSIGVGPVHTPAFDWNGLGIPKIPMLAMGGMISASGWAVVGEKGPELVKLPSGANVFPNTASQQMLGSSSSGSGGQQDIYFQMDSKVLVHMVADKQARRVRLRMGRRAA